MEGKGRMMEKLKKFFGWRRARPLRGKNQKSKNSNQEIPKEIRDKLPKGVRIMRVEIGPRQIMRALIYIVVVFWVLSVFRQLAGPRVIEKVSISEAVAEIKNEKVAEVVVTDNDIMLKLKEGDKALMTSKEPGISMTEILQKEGVEMSRVKLTIDNRSAWKAVAEIVGTLLSVGLPIVLIFWFFQRQAGAGGGGGLFGFGKSTARLFVKGKQNMTFKDVAGVEEAKKDLEEVVDFLKHPEKYRKMGARTPKGVLLVGPSGVGKCVTGKTLVLTDRGLVRIEDIPKYFRVDKNNRVKGAWVVAINKEDGSRRLVKASHWYDLGEEETIRLRVREGHEIEGTKEHPLLTVDKEGNLVFKKLKDFKKGDWIVMRVGDGVFGNWRRISEEDAYILGLLTGDGGMTIKDRIYFSSGDEELVNDFRRYFKEQFGYEIKKVKSRKYDWLVAGREIKQEMARKGLSLQPSEAKTVPETVMLGDRLLAVAFLQGLFDTDGSAEAGGGKVELTTVSRDLAEAVSGILMNLGVYHVFKRKGLNQNGVAYRIRISGQGLRVFAQEINFRLERKKKKVENYIETKRQINTNIRVYPYLGKKMDLIWEELKREKARPYLEVDENVYKNYWRFRREERGPSLLALKNFVETADRLGNDVHKMEEFKFLQNLTEGRMVFTQVRETENSLTRVFDFTVPNYHSFVGSGFVNHNTLLAKAVAGEANVPFYSMAGSEFMEMLVGVGASRVRDLFMTAKKAGRAIIFIDEIDAIGRMRGGFDGGHGEREQTLNQILVEMDGFEANTTVVVLAATNRGDLLDPALMRPGRFDRRVVLEMPDLEDRKKIIQIHARGKPFEEAIDWEQVARRTVGFSGADIENMLNEAAIGAARVSRDKINAADIEEAALKVKLGSEKRRNQTDEDKLMTAYHEAGHAIVNFMEDLDPVHRVSIVSRGMALGFTLIPPKRDRVHETKSRLIKQMAMAMGGRAAEEMVFGDITTGAAADITHATQMARNMVVEWGMSDLGPVNLGPQVDVTDFGRAFFEPSRVSDLMQAKVDEEIKKLMNQALLRARKILKENRGKLDRVAKVLVEKESLDEKEFEEIMKQ